MKLFYESLFGLLEYISEQSAPRKKQSRQFRNRIVEEQGWFRSDDYDTTSNLVRACHLPARRAINRNAANDDSERTAEIVTMLGESVDSTHFLHKFHKSPSWTSDKKKKYITERKSSCLPRAKLQIFGRIFSK